MLRALVLALLLLAPLVAPAQPLCYPLIDSTAHPRSPVVYHDGQGAGMGWYCRDGAQWRRYMMFVAYTEVKGGRVALSAMVNDESQKVLAAVDPRATAAAAHARLTATALQADCEQQPTTRQTVCKGLRTELAKYTPAALVYAVKPNLQATDGSRPTAILDADGATRTTTKNRAAANAPCDCVRLKSPSTGTDLWCWVGPNEREVALCAVR